MMYLLQLKLNLNLKSIYVTDQYSLALFDRTLLLSRILFLNVICWLCDGISFLSLPLTTCPLTVHNTYFSWLKNIICLHDTNIKHIMKTFRTFCSLNQHILNFFLSTYSLLIKYWHFDFIGSTYTHANFYSAQCNELESTFQWLT